MKNFIKLSFTLLLLTQCFLAFSQSDYQIDTIYFWNDTIKKVDTNPNGIVGFIKGRLNNEVYYIEGNKVKNFTTDLSNLLNSPYFTDIGVRENGEIYIGTFTDLYMKDTTENISKVTASNFTIGQNINSIVTFEKSIYVGTSSMQLTIDSNDVKTQFIPSGNNGYIEVLSLRRSTNSPISIRYFVFKLYSNGALSIRVSAGLSVYQINLPNLGGTKTAYGYYKFTAGNILAGGNNGIYDKRSTSNQLYQTLQDIDIQKLQEFDSLVFAGTSNGLYYADDFYQPTFSFQSICGDFYINDMAAVEDTLWIATNSGLVKMVKNSTCDLFEAAILHDTTDNILYAAMSDSTQVEWYYNGQFVSNNLSIPFSGNGDYQLIATSCSGCTDTLTNFLIGAVTTHPKQFLDVNVYPNPVTDYLYLTEFPNENYNFQIYNQLGQQISNGIIQNSRIDFSNIANGNYFVVIQSRNEAKTIKIQKQ